MPIILDGTNGITHPGGGVENPPGSAPIFGCRAWVRFDGTKDTTGATSTANTNRQILGSGNVTSVLRNSVGNYTITLTTALTDANAAVVGSGLRIAVNEGVVNVESVSTTQIVVNCTNGAGLESDFPIVSVAVFR